MTVIIALKDQKQNCIYIGCDNQGTTGSMKSDWGTKIIKLKIPVQDTEEYETIHLGISGSHYLQSYLKNAFTPPNIQKNTNFINYLYNEFFPKLNETLYEKHLLKEEDKVTNSEASIIIIHNNQIYEIYDDFSISKNREEYCCIGGGWIIATSVVHNLLKNHQDMDTKTILTEALQTVSDLNIYCNDNITIEKINY